MNTNKEIRPKSEVAPDSAMSNKYGQACPKHPVTPDGRYMVVRGRLWRVANPHLPQQERDSHVRALMAARREVKAAMAADEPDRLAAARRVVNAAKVALGERGPVWWNDGARDYNRRLVRNTPYSEWYDQLCGPHA